MKRLTLFVLLFTCGRLMAQDTIVTEDKTIFCKIYSIDQGHVRYYENGTGKWVALKSIVDISAVWRHRVDSAAGKNNALVPKWIYKDDGSEYIELVCISHVNILSSLLVGGAGDVNMAQKFEILLNPYADSTTNKGVLPYKYPLDALNYLYKKGWELKDIYSVFIGANKEIEIRHYLLKRI